MAKLKAHGSILAEATAPALQTKYRLMEDGWILVNYGAGWKLKRPAVPGVHLRQPMSPGKEIAAREVFRRLAVQLQAADDERKLVVIDEEFLANSAAARKA